MANGGLITSLYSLYQNCETCLDLMESPDINRLPMSHFFNVICLSNRLRRDGLSKIFKYVQLFLLSPWRLHNTSLQYVHNVFSNVANKKNNQLYKPHSPRSS